MKTFKILSIDGGGVRGIIPAMMLHDLEERTGKPIAEMFDLIAGTSTGGFMTLLLTKPGPDGRPLYKARDIVDLYVNHAKDIFHAPWWYRLASLGGWLRPKYPNSSPHSTFDTYLNRNAPHKLSEAVTDILITSYEIENREAFYFQRCEARRDADWDFHMADVAQATTAAPAFFPAVRIQGANRKLSLDLIDGGLVANNPSILALAEAIQEYGQEDTRYLVVSLGTGSYETPLPYRQARKWGLLAWATRIADVLFDGGAHLVDKSSKEIVEGLSAQLNRANPGESTSSRQYYRFQVSLNAFNDGTDDVDPENIRDLQKVTTGVLKEHSAEFAAIAQQLIQS